jgi:cupin fold WbuC family metalloprotein
MIERIEWNGIDLALIIRSPWDTKGVNFVTSNSNPLQVGIMNHPAGTVVKPHQHRTFDRTISETQEVLHIDSGEVEASFYADGTDVVEVRTLKSGDTILLLSGGHSFKVLADSKIIEVKQGPYYGTDEDKTRI